MTAHRSYSHILKTLVFVLFIGPGPLIGLGPWLISRWHSNDWGILRYLGAVLFLAGVPLLADSIIRFVRQGHGTPAPYAPTDKLVITGFYRHTRNPMYVGVLAMLFGQALFFGSVWLLIYAAAAALGCHLFVTGYEEPVLHERYGDQYEAYTGQVGRWLPFPFVRRSRDGADSKDLDP